jgi:hypothetical protein
LFRNDYWSFELLLRRWCLLLGRSKERSYISLHHFFFGNLKLKLSEKEDKKVPNAWSDAWGE